MTDETLTCEWCGELLKVEEADNPERYAVGNVICDECYSENYEQLCPLCENLFEYEEFGPGELYFVLTATDAGVPPGIYVANRFPYFGGSVLGPERVFPNAVTRVASLDVLPGNVAPVEHPNDGSNGQICQECIDRICDEYLRRAARDMAW